MLARRTFRSARPQDIHRNLREHFGRLKPAQISSPIINQFMAKRSNAPGMLREELIEFNATLNLALREGLIEKAVRAKLPAKKPPRDNYISKEQADQLLAAATAFHLQLFIMIATHTGMRKGAILDLTWDRVDFERTRLNFNNPEKTITNKRRTVVPVKGAIMDWLFEARKMALNEHVIEFNGKPLKDIKKSFNKAVEAAGLPNWVTPHILKHSVISWLAEDGRSVDEIADLTATNANTVRRIYRHHSPDYMKPAALSLAKNDGFASMLLKQRQSAQL
ncbi:MAG: site-specific integrase [Kordiimonadaceae bacterium]|nr:site-specific integrase [Kordiimonadaceae bacterium]